MEKRGTKHEYERHYSTACFAKIKTLKLQNVSEQWEKHKLVLLPAFVLAENDVGAHIV